MELLISDEKHSLPLCVYVAGFGKASHNYQLAIASNTSIIVVKKSIILLFFVFTYYYDNSATYIFSIYVHNVINCSQTSSYFQAKDSNMHAYVYSWSQCTISYHKQ